MFRNMIPYGFRLLRVRLKWFLKHYRFISAGTGIYESELHGPATYKTDGLITSNNCDFIKEEKFARAYLKAAETKPWEGFTLQWRTYIVCWFANHVKYFEGDFVECGVNTGAYSIAVMEYIEFEKLDKDFYLMDTFSGLDKTQVTEAEKKAGIDMYFDAYKNVYEQVKKTFSAYKRVKIIKGAIPATLSECHARSVCYLSIDMNCVAPEIAAINFFWDKVVSGGVILLDDYGFPMHINQKLAFDEFAKSKNTEILSLPTGQGIILKR